MELHAIEKIAVTQSHTSDPDAGSTLVAMLIGGLGLIAVGGLVVMAFV